LAPEAEAKVKLTGAPRGATTGGMPKAIRLGRGTGRALSPLALEIAAQMNAGKSLDQIRAHRPDLTDEHIAAFMREMFERMGFAPQAATVACNLVRSGGRRNRAFIEGHFFKLRVVLDDVKPQVWRRLVVPVDHP
jgi:hypothetical protein